MNNRKNLQEIARQIDELEAEQSQLNRKQQRSTADVERQLAIRVELDSLRDERDRIYGNHTANRLGRRDAGVNRDGSESRYRSATGGRILSEDDRIFADALRGRSDALAELENRASNDTSMNIGTSADGGYAVPTGHFQGVIEKMRPQSLYQQLGCMEVPGVGTTVNVPIDDEADDGAFVVTGEESGFDRDAPALNQVQMTLVKYTKKIELSVELLEDEDSRLLDYLESYVADGMAATVNSLLVTEVLANGTAGLTLDAAAAIGAAEVPELLYKLKSEYFDGRSVNWLMDRATEGHIRGKIGDPFQFAPTPAGRVGSRAELFGTPIYTSSYMPDIGGGNKSMVIGNWSKMLYRFGPQMQFLRDPYTLGHLGQVRLLYFFRCVFKVGIAEAFQYSTHPTS